jgi:hypothetical protein
MTDEQDDRKKRVIHTRVPESLDRELREKASTLGVSVSNLVRNVLLNAFGLVGGIVADGAKVAESARSAAPVAPGEGEPAAAVIGWQELMLGVNAICVTCNEVLTKGSSAAIAVTNGVGPRPVLCLTCLEELRDDS